MEWRDEGAVLSMRPHGESAAIIEVFTREHGRHAGVVRGGTSRRMAPHVQPGTQVAVVWTARLAEHIGAYTLEPIRSRAHVLGDRLALAGLSSICALLSLALPERDPHEALWQRSTAMLDRLGAAGWLRDYLAWEMQLLEAMGFGLDLSSCAVTGGTGDLVYVSPKTGRAVSRAGAGEWAERLLPLPEGMVSGAAMTAEAIRQGLKITGHFLDRALSGEAMQHSLPEARGRLIDLLNRDAVA
ncbi:DNA repair protein RecO [Xinfangfangia sp. CPCC 101601]|uniref:DNA repair protein RecO n=1 Tax=Pseudogemmobacter lacusdianii TaxID=3069608 RepID=A0ABU0VXH8_9RHOB|nr:DNA repair protein RecO [Xinfangfangia sp. CPCC 101601]MDQ2066419.1 DNA repair protein RecO [Xinfangfangia sp. CPCC 101601]